jgi:aerobic carbon-monoxide dehydrogenase small subunit
VSGARLIGLTVNGRAREVRAAPATTLLTVLRDELQLTGTKRGCNQGVCGACTVLVDGRPVRGCLSLAMSLAGRAVTTVEGLAQGRALAPVQRALIAGGAVQCGFCISGVLISAAALLRENPHPSAEEASAALSGNLCRCSGYTKIIAAVCGVGDEARS